MPGEGFDVIGPLPPTEREHRYINDYFTKAVEAEPMNSQDAGTAAKVFIKRWVCQHGAPLSIFRTFAFGSHPHDWDDNLPTSDGVPNGHPRLHRVLSVSYDNRTRNAYPGGCRGTHQQANTPVIG